MKTKTKIKIILTTIVLLILITSLYIIFTDKFPEVNEANENMKILNLQLLMVRTEIGNDFEDLYNEIPQEWGPSYYSHKENQTRIMFDGFPDLGDHSSLTSIRFIDENSSFYGIFNGDKITKAVERMNEHGYEVDENSNNESEIKKHLFRKGRVAVSFTYDNNDIINSISIGLWSTNEAGIQY